MNFWSNRERMFSSPFEKLKLILDISPRQLVRHFRKKYSKGERLGEFDVNHPCVFVLSTGRVGTQTLSSIFKLATNIFAYHEPKPLLYGLSKLSYEFSNNTLVRKVLREAFLIARKEIMEYSLFYGRGYVETSPQTTFLAPIILEAIPNARFIHVVRDPRDVVRSGMRRKWYDGHVADKTRIVPNHDSEEGIQWRSFTIFQKNLWLWTETNKWIHKFSTGLPNDRILLICAEDLFTVHEEIIEKLFAFIDSPIPSKRQIKRVLSKSLNSQKDGIFPEVSDWSGEMRKDLISIAGSTAEVYGYKL